MVRAGHRPEHELLVVDLDGRIHRILVVRVVAAFLIQLKLRDIRRIDVEVAALDLLVGDKTLELAPHDRALRRKKGKSLAD